jgi:ubiquinone/menaquinone biosynthesis C-methylase UbiE
VNYDDIEVAARYDEARQLSGATLDTWLEAVALYAGSEPIRLIIDIGCGTGRFSGRLAGRFDAHVVGIDPSLAMLDQAKSKRSCAHVNLCAGTAEALPLAARAADMIFLSMVYHHLADTVRAAAEFRRLLREHGLLCIRNSTADLLHRVPYLRYFPSAVECNRRRLPLQNDLIATLQSAGFSLLRHHVIEQEFASSFEEYVAKIGKRALSDLVLLPDVEFQEGMRRLENAAPNVTGPVVEPVDLFVFQRTD